MKLRVKELCQKKGITQKALSEKLGIAEISLSRSINGNPTVSTLENIANALGVSVTDLFEPNEGDFFTSKNNNSITCPNCGVALQVSIEKIESKD